MKKIYLDYAATTPVKPEVVAAMMPFFTSTEDYSDDLKSFQKQFMKRIGAQSGSVIFNSGGSFGNNEVIKSFAYSNLQKGRHIMTSKIEHPSVYKVFEKLENEGFEVSMIEVNKDGVVDLDDFIAKLRPDTSLVSVMMINNELGSRQPIEAIQRICNENHILFHVDGVQALGHFQLDVEKLGVDAMTFSSHKVYAPKGCGAIYIKEGVTLWPLISDCEPYGLKRSLNIAYIAGFVKGIEIAYDALETNFVRKNSLKQKLIQGLLNLDLGIKVNGSPELTQNHPGIVNLYYPPMDGDSLVINYDFAGIAISSGSACSSGALSASHVLKAIGLSENEAKKCIRITIGDFTTEDDIEAFIEATKRILKGTKNVR